MTAQQDAEKVEFARRVQQAQSALSKKHMDENMAFLAKHPVMAHVNRTTVNITPGPNSIAMNPQHQGLSTPTPTPASSSTTKPNGPYDPAKSGVRADMPASAVTNKQLNPRAQKQALPNGPPTAAPKAGRKMQRARAPTTPVVIDLVFDDDEDSQPVKTAAAAASPGASNARIPSGSIVFFSGGGQDNKVRDSASAWEYLADDAKQQVKQETPAYGLASRAGSAIPYGSSTLPHKASGSSPVRGKKVIPADPQPEISLDVLRRQRLDCSPILTSPPRLPRDPGLLHLQQQKKDGAFVSNVLHNARSQSWAFNLRNLLGRPMDDIEMQDASNAQSSSAQHVFGPSRRNERAASGLRRPSTLGAVGNAAPAFASQPRLQNDRGNVVPPENNSFCVGDCGPSPFELPPNPFAGKVGNGNTVVSGPSSKPSMISSGSFKVPALPAQTTPAPVTPGTLDSERTRGNTVFSQGSSRTLANSSAQALNDLRSQRVASTAFSPTGASPSVKRKKLVLDVSSDDEFQPSLPSSPANVRKANATVKKSKPASTSSSSTSSVSGKASKFGFKGPKPQIARPTTPPLPFVSGRSMSSTPGAPTRKSRRVHGAPTPGSPSAHKRLKRTPAPTALPDSPDPPLRTLTPRFAKLAAKSRIVEFSKDNEEFRTEEQIRAPDAMDARLNNVPVAAPNSDHLGRRMRNLSLTPAPTHNNDGGEYSGEEAGREGSVYSSEKWRRNREKGDRLLARFKDGIAGRESSESELGVDAILRRAERMKRFPREVEEMDLMGI
jgi:hypothetical protein